MNSGKIFSGIQFPSVIASLEDELIYPYYINEVYHSLDIMDNDLTIVEKSSALKNFKTSKAILLAIHTLIILNRIKSNIFPELINRYKCIKCEFLDEENVSDSEIESIVSDLDKIVRDITTHVNGGKSQKLFISMQSFTALIEKYGAKSEVLCWRDLCEEGEHDKIRIFVFLYRFFKKYESKIYSESDLERYYLDNYFGNGDAKERAIYQAKNTFIHGSRIVLPFDSYQYVDESRYLPDHILFESDRLLLLSLSKLLERLGSINSSEEFNLIADIVFAICVRSSISYKRTYELLSILPSQMLHSETVESWRSYIDHLKSGKPSVFLKNWLESHEHLGFFAKEKIEEISYLLKKIEFMPIHRPSIRSGAIDSEVMYIESIEIRQVCHIDPETGLGYLETIRRENLKAKDRFTGKYYESLHSLPIQFRYEEGLLPFDEEITFNAILKCANGSKSLHELKYRHEERSDIRGYIDHYYRIELPETSCGYESIITEKHSLTRTAFIRDLVDENYEAFPDLCGLGKNLMIFGYITGKNPVRNLRHTISLPSWLPLSMLETGAETGVIDSKVEKPSFIYTNSDYRKLDFDRIEEYKKDEVLRHIKFTSNSLFMSRELVLEVNLLESEFLRIPDARYGFVLVLPSLKEITESYLNWTKTRKHNRLYSLK